MNWENFGTVLVICGTALYVVARVMGMRTSPTDPLVVAGLCLFIIGLATIMGAITGVKDA